MKTVMYFFLTIVALIIAICSIITLSTNPFDTYQVIGVLLIALISMAFSMIFGYLFYINMRKMKEDHMYDLAAKAQLERDYLYAEY